MICLACSGPSPSRLCGDCLRTLRPAPDRILAGGTRVIAAFAHEGAARDIVHLLKYRAVPVTADIIASALAPRLPLLPLVPVPRVLTRRLRYGVDQATVMARALSRLTGSEVVGCLGAPVHAWRRAGRNREAGAPAFRLRGRPPESVVLVDDVITTGATLLSAIAALPPGVVRIAVVANSAPVSSLSGVSLPGHPHGL